MQLRIIRDFMCTLLLLLLVVLQGKLLHSIANRIKSEKNEEEFVARIHRLVARTPTYGRTS